MAEQPIPDQRASTRPTDDNDSTDTWWELNAQQWPTLGAGCHSSDRSVELTFRLLDRR